MAFLNKWPPPDKRPAVAQKVNKKSGSAVKAEGGSGNPSHASLQCRIADADDD